MDRIERSLMKKKRLDEKEEEMEELMTMIQQILEEKDPTRE